jgi:hypothetical protein
MVVAQLGLKLVKLMILPTTYRKVTCDCLYDALGQKPLKVIHTNTLLQIVIFNQW